MQLAGDQLASTLPLASILLAFSSVKRRYSSSGVSRLIRVHPLVCGGSGREERRRSYQRGARGDAHRHIIFSFILSATGKRSTEMSFEGTPLWFCHQCEVPFFSDATSPALCTIGTAQLLAYSTTSPLTM